MTSKKIRAMNYPLYGVDFILNLTTFIYYLVVVVGKDLGKL